ncbi:MAG: winged helix-turn-helix domain-containing protein [Bacteroidetes bacterium]|nr:winged helix-turn-helix domain-containing protein [Bacteroidota bacterium]
MARQRTAHIHESLEFLLNLEQHYRGESQEPRIKVLRLLKENPTRTLEQAASLAGSSERSANRWWAAYQSDGIEGLLSNRTRAGSRASTLGRHEIDELRNKLHTGELTTLNDVQTWLEQRFGLRYSLKGVANLLQRKLKARRMWLVSDGGEIRVAEGKAVSAAAEKAVIPDNILHFLNRLPLTNDTQRAVDRYREALLELIGEVDRVSIYVNINCALQDPDEYQPDMMITVDATSGVEGVSVTSYHQGERPSDRLLDNFRSQGLPVDQFHPPVSFDYYYNDHAYLGTIFLWRDRTKPITSERSRNTVALMEPFIIYMLSDLIARYHYAHPVDRMFHDALKNMTQEAGLSTQERRVVMLRLLGLSYKEIADQLSISEDAIKKHLGSVHRKTGTRSYTELFAKYFTPRLNLHNS